MGRGGYCPHYQTIVSLWGSVVASSNYQPNQLVKEEDIVVNKDLFLINAETGSLYFAGGGTYAQIPAIDGHEDFMYIAGEGEAIGALSILGGLYVVNQSTKQWELKYKDTVRTYGYAHLARFSTGWVFYKGAAGDGKNYVIIVYDDGTVKERSVVGPVSSISTGPYDYCTVNRVFMNLYIYSFRKQLLFFLYCEFRWKSVYHFLYIEVLVPIHTYPRFFMLHIYIIH